jgi:hypothetical protein
MDHASGRGARSVAIVRAWQSVPEGGLAVAFTPSTHQPFLGWCLLGVASLVLFLLIDRCITLFAAFMGLATLSSLICIFSGQINGSPIKVSRVAHTLPFMYATQTVALRPIAPVVQGSRSGGSHT